jgi:hypothetical protein
MGGTFTVLKEKEIVTHATTQTELEGAILCTISQLK